MFYIRDSLICSQIEVDLPEDMEIICIDLNLRSQKWLLIGAYKPPTQNPDYFFQNLESMLATCDYDNILIMGDLNMEPSNTHFQHFCSSHGLESIVNQPTCFKSVNNPSTIDHILVTYKSNL